MLVKVNLDNKAFSLINELIAEGKYPDLYRFIEIAINNQIQEEFAEESAILIPKITEDEISYLESKEVLSEKESQLREIMGKEKWQEKLREIHLEKSEIEPIKSDLIWSFYNRFLPVKIVIHELAVLMAKHGTWIELAQLKDYAYAFALEISEALKKYEDQYDVPRNLKLSTGLPTPLSEFAGLKGAKKRKKELKLLSSKTRFMEQFVGRKTSGKNPEFHGAGFSMGLIVVKFVNNTCFVSLTENGRDFALFNNPVIDGQQKEVAFFNDEVNFIMENIIPRYPFEKIIVERILDELKKRPLTSNEINEIFKDTKESYLLDQKLSSKQIEDALDDGTIVQERVATMGRLSELGLVKWVIDSSGYSSYTIKAK